VRTQSPVTLSFSSSLWICSFLYGAIIEVGTLPETVGKKTWQNKFMCLNYHRPIAMIGWANKSTILARYVIYRPTSRAYATRSLSVCLSVCLWRLCIVVTGCNGSRISLHAWIDGCICYLLTTYEKIGNCSNITYFTYWESGPETCDSFVYINWHFYNRSCWVFFINLGRKCIISG